MFKRRTKPQDQDHEIVIDDKPLGLIPTPEPTAAEKAQVDAYLKLRVFENLHMYFQQSNVRRFSHPETGTKFLSTPHIEAFICGEQQGVVASVKDTGSELEAIYFYSTTHGGVAIGYLHPQLDAAGEIDYVAKAIEGAPIDFSTVTGLELDGFSNNLTVYLMNEPKKEIVLDPNDIPSDEFEIPVDLNRANIQAINVPGHMAFMYQHNGELGVVLQKVPEPAVEADALDAEAPTLTEVSTPTTTTPAVTQNNAPSATTPELNIPAISR